MYILYQTDAWLSYSSRDLIGVCTTKEKALILARRQAKRSGKKLTEDEIANLTDIMQTQGRDINYSIEKVPVNTLL